MKMGVVLRKVFREATFCLEHAEIWKGMVINMKITVLAGGTSTERDVSLVTGSMIYKSLVKSGHQVVLVDLYLGYDGADYTDVFAIKKDWSESIQAISSQNPDIRQVRAMRKDDPYNEVGPHVIDICKQSDIVFLALHGQNGEDGKVQAMFDLLHIKYTGTDYFSSALAMDKVISKELFIKYDIPTPKGITLTVGQEAQWDTYPCIVKVNRGGSSVGVYKAENAQELQDALKQAFSFEKRVLIEEYIDGREFSIGVMDGKALPIIEIAPKVGFYDYKNKYYLGGSFRTDGSSRFQRDNRWGSFWSISGAWRIIEEEFMSPTKNWLTDLKIRASYGVNGTLPSDYFGYMGLSSLTNGYLEQPGIIQSQLRNDDLQWETNYNLNLGLDFALWNRINVTLEYYTRTTKNLLMDRPISMTTGFGSYLMNIGEVKNKGVELEISSTNIQTKDFSWNTTFNISHNKNKIVTLDGMQTEIKSGSQIRKVGKSYRTFYMIEFAGINPETGAPQFYTNDVDENGNYIKDITEEINKAHAIVLDKHAEPNAIGGLSNTLRYKWFDLNFMFSYQFGGYSYDNWAQKTEHGGNDLEANIPSYYKDSWKKPGDVTKYELFYEKPSVAMNKVTTTRRLHSTDFIRLKTLTFGFTVPKDWTQKIGIENVRLYASANNLWTWAAYDYYDPEAVSGGTAIWGTPPLKTVTFGINVNF